METGYFEEHKSEVNEVVIKELYLNNDKRFVVLDISRAYWIHIILVIFSE
jgi:hypothetical protein